MAVSPTKSPVAASGRSGRARGLGRSMSVKDMKAERDAKLAQRDAEKAEMAAAGTIVSPSTSPRASPRAGLVAPSPVSPAKAPAAASGRSGRGRGLGRSMSVKDMKAERDAKLAQREAEKAEKSESPAASPRAQATPVASPRSALKTPVAAAAPALKPTNAPSNWERMSKLEQIKWKKENASRAQVKWSGAATNVKVITAFNAASAVAAAARSAPAEQDGLPTNWGEMSTTDRIKWRREHSKPAGWGSPQVSPTVSPRAATAKEPDATDRAEVASPLPSATTEAALQRQVDELTRQKEAILLAAIDEIKALEDKVEAYRQAVGTVEQAQALAATREESHPPEGVVPLTLRGIAAKTDSGTRSSSPRSPAAVASQASDDNSVDMSESDDDSVDVSSSDEDDD